MIKTIFKNFIVPPFNIFRFEIFRYFNSELLNTLWKYLTPLEREAIKFKPSLVSKKYKKVSKGSMIHRAITSKPGTPGLALKDVK